jgi:hypothetical protein
MLKWSSNVAKRFVPGVVFLLSTVLGLLWLLLGFSIRDDRWLVELREVRRVSCEADI